MEDGLGGLTVFLDGIESAIIPSPAERTDSALLRSRLAQPGDSERAHLGEAETLAVVSGRRISAIFLTDDHGATSLAKSLDIPVASTLDLLRVAVGSGKRLGRRGARTGRTPRRAR